MTRSEPGESGLLGRRDFIRLAEFVHARSGIRMPPSKRSFLESRIRRHLSALGFATMNEYCRWLFDKGGLVRDETALLEAVNQFTEGGMVRDDITALVIEYSP